MAQLTNQDEFIKTALRLPRKIHAQTQQAATESGRSMNAEIIHRLENSFTSSVISDELVAMIGIMAIATKEFASSIDPTVLPIEKQRFIEILEQAATQIFDRLPKK